VTGRPDIERNIVTRDDVRRLADFMPGVERKGDVMKFTGLGAPNEGNVMSLVRAAQERRNYPVRCLGGLGQGKVEHFDEKLDDAVDVRAVQVAVVETGHPHPMWLVAPHLRIAGHRPIVG
jgi:hypothetical protein